MTRRMKAIQLIMEAAGLKNWGCLANGEEGMEDSRALVGVDGWERMVGRVGISLG